MPGNLTHPPSRVVLEALVSEGIGTDGSDETGEWPIYVSRSPDRPDDMLLVSDTQGVDFGDTQVDGERQERNGIQVMIRCADYHRGYAKALEVARFLDRLARLFVTVDDVGTGTGSVGTQYIIHSAKRTTNVIPLGSDTPQGKRQLFTVNAHLSLRQCCPEG